MEWQIRCVKTNYPLSALYGRVLNEECVLHRNNDIKVYARRGGDIMCTIIGVASSYKTSNRRIQIIHGLHHRGSDIFPGFHHSCTNLRARRNQNQQNQKHDNDRSSHMCAASNSLLRPNELPVVL